MLTMLFVGMGSYAQTTVEFVAGVDKGTKTAFKPFIDVADEVTKKWCNDAQQQRHICYKRIRCK